MPQIPGFENIRQVPAPKKLHNQTFSRMLAIEKKLREESDKFNESDIKRLEHLRDTAVLTTQDHEDLDYYFGGWTGVQLIPLKS